LKRPLSQEPIEQFAAVAVKRWQIADEELNAVFIGHDECLAAQASDVFFTPQNKLGFSTVGLDRPDRRRDETADRIDTLNFRHEFTRLERRHHSIFLRLRQGAYWRLYEAQARQKEAEEEGLTLGTEREART